MNIFTPSLKYHKYNKVNLNLFNKSDKRKKWGKTIIFQLRYLQLTKGYSRKSIHSLFHEWKQLEVLSMIGQHSLIFGPQIWFSMQHLAHLDHLDLPQPYAIGFSLTHWPKTNFAISRPKNDFLFLALKIDFKCNAWLTWIILTCPSLTPLVLVFHIGQRPTLRLWGQNLILIFGPQIWF